MPRLEPRTGQPQRDPSKNADERPSLGDGLGPPHPTLRPAYRDRALNAPERHRHDL